MCQALRFRGTLSANVFDAGVDGVNGVSDTVIANNTITNAITAGIGAYHCTNWHGNTVSGNVVSQSESAVDIFAYFDPICAQLPNPPSTAAFSRNTVSGNILRRPIENWPGIFISFSPGDVSGNVIRGNDLGSQGIRVFPLEAFTNGGGNICGTQDNFHC